MQGVPRLLLLASAAVVCAALTWTQQGAAEELKRATLHYEVDGGIEGCFERPELEDAVAARLGYVPFVAEAPLDISAHVHRSRTRLSADLKVQGDGGTKTRQLDSATRDCGELSRALALAISVAIDPLSLVRAAPPPPPAEEKRTEPAPPPSEPPKAETPPPPAAPSPAPKAPSSSPAAPPARGSELDSNLHLRWLVTGHAAILALPGMSGGLSAGVGLRRRSLWTDLELRYDLPASKSADGGGKVQAQFLGGTWAICHGNRRFGVCPVGFLGRLSGKGNGVQAPASASSLHAGVGARLLAELPLFGSVFLRVHLDGFYVLTPTSLELRGREVWKSSPISIIPGAGLGGQL